MVHRNSKVNKKRDFDKNRITAAANSTAVRETFVEMRLAAVSIRDCLRQKLFTRQHCQPVKTVQRND